MTGTRTRQTRPGIRATTRSGADTLRGADADPLPGGLRDDRIDVEHQAEITDFSAGEDMLVVLYDGAAGPAPDVSLAPDAEDPASQRLLFGGADSEACGPDASIGPASHRPVLSHRRARRDNSRFSLRPKSPRRAGSRGCPAPRETGPCWTTSRLVPATL